MHWPSYKKCDNFCLYYRYCENVLQFYQHNPFPTPLSKNTLFTPCGTFFLLMFLFENGWAVAYHSCYIWISTCQESWVIKESTGIFLNLNPENACRVKSRMTQKSDWGSLQCKESLFSNPNETTERWDKPQITAGLCIASKINTLKTYDIMLWQMDVLQSSAGWDKKQRCFIPLQ